MFRPLLRTARITAIPRPQHIFPPHLHPLAPFSTTLSQLRHAPPPSKTRRKESAFKHIPPPPPPPEQEYEFQDAEESKTPGFSLIVIFAMISIPVTILNQFPGKVLPPAPDPKELQHLSKTPLTLSIWAGSPAAAAQLFVMRLRRGEYATFMRNNFSFSPLNYMGIAHEAKGLREWAIGKLPNPPAESWRWWTWGTYAFSHGSIIHWVFCFTATSSLVPILAGPYGVARALGIFAVGGIGTAALDCTIEAAMHKSDFQERTAVQMVKRKLVVEDSTGFRQERTAMSIEPAPGLVGVFSQNVGSSGALMAMISIVAIAIPQSKWGLMFIPYSMAARTMYGGLVAFDVAGVLGITPNMGIGHMGHLCGDVMGVLIYVLWLKRLPVSLIMKRMRKDAGFR